MPLDLTDLARTKTLIRDLAPDAIVHPAAYTAVDKAEVEAKLAMAINRDAVAVLGEEAKNRGIPIISFSTDYVFSGEGTKPWNEFDVPSPLGVYGASKLAGEQALAASGAEHVIMRTSWVFGVHGANFVKTMLRLAGERPILRVVADQIGAPTSASFLARMTRLVLEKGFSRGEFRTFSGIYHVACAGETSWHGFASAIIARARALGFPIITESIEPIPSDAYPTPAKRPKNSRLDCQKFMATFGAMQSHWADELDLTLQTLAPKP